ncbi:MAG: hypothetical protein LUG65_03135 [Clostridiales bacterium]|nr:hypothetical protein [Clostridiales bacterium]
MSDEKKQRKSAADRKLEASLKNLSGGQRSKAEAQKKEQRRWKMYGALAIVIAVLVAALLFWDSGFIQKRSTAITIGEKSYTSVDVSYYYYLQYNSISTYASYYGLDTSVSLKKQEAYEGKTWYAYIRDYAESALTSVSILVQEGEAAGYELSEDGQADIDEALADMEETCDDYGITVSYYLKQMYGRYMTLDRYKNLLNEYYYAIDYQEYKTSSFEVTEDEMEEYYEENKDTLDTYDYLCYYIDAAPETQYDADGTELDATDEEIEEAAAAAKALAEELQQALESGDEDTAAALVSDNSMTDYSDTSPSSFSSYTFGDWLVDEERTAGDSTVIEDTTETEVEVETDDADSADSSTDPADTSGLADASTDPADASNQGDSSAETVTTQTVTTIEGYYVVYFSDRYRDDYYAANVRNILIEAEEDEEDEESEETTYLYDDALATAEELQQTWLDNGGTEDDFIDLVADNSADTSTNEDGGLNSTVYKGVLDATLEAWVLDESRASGDYTILLDETNIGYQLLYFVGFDDLYYWQTIAQSSLQSDAFDDWYEEVEENYEVTTTWFYNQVG